MNGGPLLESANNGDRLALSAAGTWTAERAGELEGLIGRVIARHPKVGERLDRTPGLLGGEVPQGAIQGIAGRTRRQDALQPATVEAPRDLRPQAGNGGRHPLDGFTIPPIGHTFAATAM